MAKKTLYDVLQVSRNADPETIKAAYKSLVQRYHPDKNPDNPDAEKNLKIINRAYEVLSDPVKRAGYDAALAEDDEDQFNQTAERATTGQWKKPSNSSDASASEPLSNHDLYAAYLGEKNQAYYLEKFERFDRLGDGMHISWNWPAFITFLFGATWWALYRKLYAWFFALFILGAVILGLTPKHIPEAAFVIGVVPATAFGMFANVIYYRKVKAKIAATQSITRSNDELIKLLIKKGGVHSWVWWILWVWLVVAVIGIIAAIAIPAYSDYTKKAKAHETVEPQTATVSPYQSSQETNRDTFSQTPEATILKDNGQNAAREVVAPNIRWDNERYGVTTEKQNNISTRENLERQERLRMGEYERLERAADHEKAARMEMTAKLENERVEKERLGKERLGKEKMENERLESERLEKEKLKNNAEWLEKEKENYRNRVF